MDITEKMKMKNQRALPLEEEFLRSDPTVTYRHEEQRSEFSQKLVNNTSDNTFTQTPHGPDLSSQPTAFFSQDG